MTTAILDAAQQVFEQYGARRANLEDVARAAGISKSTLYRAYATKEELLRAVLDRQLTEFLAELDATASDLEPREAVVECFVRGMAMTREIPLLSRLAVSEPEVITGAGGSSNAGVVLGAAHQVAVTLRRSGARMPDEELHVVAELMLRLAYTYLLNPSGQIDMTDEHQVREFARKYLAALVS